MAREFDNIDARQILCAYLAWKYDRESFPNDAWKSQFLAGAPGDLARGWAIGVVSKMSERSFPEGSLDQAIFKHVSGYAGAVMAKVIAFPSRHVLENSRNLERLQDQIEAHDQLGVHSAVDELLSDENLAAIRHKEEPSEPAAFPREDEWSITDVYCPHCNKRRPVFSIKKAISVFKTRCVCGKFYRVTVDDDGKVVKIEKVG